MESNNNSQHNNNNRSNHNNISSASKQDEFNNSKNGKPKVILDRSQLMDNMLFPENCETLIIVPSNKEGTGFLNHCYDEAFLKDYISEKDFNAIVMISSKMAAKCYSKKKLLDKKGVDKVMKFILTIASLLAMVSLYTVLEGFVGGEDQTLLYFSHVLIAPSLISVFVVSIINWKQKVVRPITFNEMVKHDLDELFAKINPDFKQHGLEWATIDGHYWLEVRINPQKKQGNLRSNLQKNLQKKLMRILQNADIKVTDKLMKSITLGGPNVESQEDNEDNDLGQVRSNEHNNQDLLEHTPGDTSLSKQNKKNNNKNSGKSNKVGVMSNDIGSLNAQDNDLAPLETEQEQLVDSHTSSSPNKKRQMS